MTADQLATLKAKIDGDADLLALWQAGTPVPIAEALSDPANATYVGTVTLTARDPDSLLTALRPALLTLPSATAEIQSKWDRVASWIRGSASVVIDASSIALFGSAVTDGILTSDQATACYQRAGSWAEVQFGAGTVLSWQDVVAAMNS